jgi:hypothetical protein
VKFLQPVSWSLLHPELWTSTSYVLLFAGAAFFTALAAGIAGGLRAFWPLWTIGICAVVAGLLPGFWSLPVIKAVQFPWRALVLAEFGLATALASTRISPVGVTAALTPLMMLALMMFNAHNPMHGEPMVPLPIPGMQDVVEYLPPGAVGPLRTPRADVIRRAVAVAQAQPGSTFRFPSLRARCGDGGVSPLRNDAASPLLARAPTGCHVEVTRLPVEKIGLAISLCAWLGLLAAALRRGVRRRDDGSAYLPSLSSFA